MFDTGYMQKLFNLAYEMAKNGYPWEKYPPGYKPLEENTVQPDSGNSSLP